MSDRARYRALVASHIAEVEAWIAEDPARWDEPGRTFGDYCQEYGHRFAITAHKAQDIDYPRADAMLEELSPFEDLFG